MSEFEHDRRLEGDPMVDKDEIRARLTERIAALMSQIGRIEGELGQPLDDDFAEQAVDREDDEALDALESSALAEIELIRKAIARLDAGSYGLCVSCGDVIAAERAAGRCGVHRLCQYAALPHTLKGRWSVGARRLYFAGIQTFGLRVLAATAQAMLTVLRAWRRHRHPNGIRARFR